MLLGEVTLKSVSSLPAAGSALSVVLLEVAFDAASPTEVAVVVRGVTNGESVDVEAGYDGSVAAAPAAVTSGLFEASVPLGPVWPLTAPLRIEAVASDGAGATVEDAAVLSLNGLAASSSAGVVADVNPARLGFLGGSTDRLVSRRSFVPLRPTRGGKYVGPDSIRLPGGGLMNVDVRVAHSEFEKRLERLRAELDSGRLREHDFSRAADEALEQAIDRATSAGATAEVRRPGVSSTDSPTASHAVQPRARVMYGRAGAIGDPLRGPDTEAEAKRGLTNLWKGSRPTLVGVLFDERLRFQPTGLVLGEEVATVSLAPGEQVEVRQTVETKRRAVLEDIQDREEERQTTFSSTWSTEITEAFSRNEQQSESTSLDLRAGASVPIPDTPVTVDAGAVRGTRVETAHNASTEIATGAAAEETRTAANKLRAQHRVRVEITTEQSSGIVSTRTLRNANQERGTTFVLRKVYRRDRVAHERYGSRLCLRVPVTNPVRDTLAEFVRRAAELHPDRVVARLGPPPPASEASGKIEFVVRAGEVLDGSTEWITLRHDARDVRLRSEFEGDLDARAVLLEVGSPRLVELDVQRAEAWVGTVPEVKETDELTGAEARGLYRDMGGLVRWQTAPQIGQTHPVGVLAVDFPRDRSGPGHSDLPIWAPLIQVSRLALEANTVWGPKSSDVLAYAAQVADLRAQAYANFNEADVFALRDAATRVYAGQVVERALTLLGRTRAVTARLFDLDDVFVESEPWWASALGTENAELVRETLRALPLGAPVDDFIVPALTAGEATAFIPIARGQEASALALVDDLYDPIKLTEQIADYRESHFAPNAAATPSYDEILGPGEPAGTAAGAASWANAWEEPPQAFDVLGAWSELIPIDGLHTEMLLSATSGADEGAIARARPSGP